MKFVINGADGTPLHNLGLKAEPVREAIPVPVLYTVEQQVREEQQKGSQCNIVGIPFKDWFMLTGTEHKELPDGTLFKLNGKAMEYTIEVDSLDEILKLAKLNDWGIIIAYGEHWTYPIITLYNDYVE